MGAVSHRWHRALARAARRAWFRLRARSRAGGHEGPALLGREVGVVGRDPDRSHPAFERELADPLDLLELGERAPVGQRRTTSTT